MEIQGSLGQIKDLITEAKKIIVFGHKNPNLDSTASLLAFGQIFEKLEKDYMLVCQDGVPQEYLFLQGSSLIKDTLGSRNLVIGIKNGKELVEKVSYYTQGEDFNLVISPRNKSISAEQIIYSFTGLEADLLIVLDTIRLNGLGPIYETFSQDFKDLPLINIDRHSQNDRYGKVNLIDSSYSSTAELVYKVAEEMEIDVEKDLATILLAGVYGGSHNFLSQTTSVKSFETSAKLVEKGADLSAILSNMSGSEHTDKNQNDSGSSDNKEPDSTSAADDFEGNVVPQKNEEPIPAMPEGTTENPVNVSEQLDDTEIKTTEEYHLPTPTLQTLDESQEDGPFRDPKLS